MPDYSDIERVFEMVEDARAREAKATGFPVPRIGDDEKAEAYRWANGNELRNIVDTPGFEIIMYKLQTYMDDGINDLFRGTNPTDEKAVLAKFAVGYAACAIFERLKNDINADIEAAKTVPDIVKQGMRLTRGAPVDAATVD